jgi:K+ transporter
MDGGWLPLALGLIVFTVMTTWLAGRRRLAEASRERSLPIDTFLASLAINPRTASAARPSSSPPRLKEYRWCYSTT